MEIIVSNMNNLDVKWVKKNHLIINNLGIKYILINAYGIKFLVIRIFNYLEKTKVYKLKTNLILNKSFILVILTFLVVSLVIVFVIFKKYDSESEEDIESKRVSKQVLEEFINHHINKKNSKYTKNIIKTLFVDENKYKKGLASEISLEISEKSKFNLSILKISGNNAYYVLEIPTKNPSESEPDFNLTYYFKLIKINEKWLVEKICSICDITKF